MSRDRAPCHHRFRRYDAGMGDLGDYLLHGLVTASVIGLLVCAVCVMIHGAGTTVIVHFLRARGYQMLHGHGLVYAALALVMTTLWLMLLHMIQIVVWAEVYLHLVGIVELQDIETALYFSAVTYTTLGYGDVVLHDHWRIMSAIEAMNGIMLFGWSTALLFGVVREIIRQIDPVAEAYERKVQRRMAELEAKQAEAEKSDPDQP